MRHAFYAFHRRSRIATATFAAAATVATTGTEEICTVAETETDTNTRTYDGRGTHKLRDRHRPMNTQ